jgi:hypothetical protein
MTSNGPRAGVAHHHDARPPHRMAQRARHRLQRPGRRARRTPGSERIYGGCSFTFEGQTLGLRPVAVPGDTFDPNRVGLDHLSLLVSSVEELHQAAERLQRAGDTHGQVTELPAFGLAVLSIQDPDDINLELSARLTGP